MRLPQPIRGGPILYTAPMPETPCPGCGYPLAGTSLARCPECGISTDPVALAQATTDLTHRCVRWSGWMLLAIVAADGLGRAITFLPRSGNGSSGSGPLAGETFALLPKVLLAAMLSTLLTLKARPGPAPLVIRATLIAWILTSFASNAAFGGAWNVTLNGSPLNWWYDATRITAAFLTPIGILLAQHVLAAPIAQGDIASVLASPARWVRRFGFASVLLVAALTMIEFLPPRQFAPPTPGTTATPTPSWFALDHNQRQSLTSWARWPATMFNFLQTAGLGMIVLLAMPPRKPAS